MAATPTITLSVAATRNDPLMPIAPIRTNPDTRAPAIAPAVLIPYKRLMRVPTPSIATMEERKTSGSVAPMRMVGGSRTSAEQTSRASVSVRAGAAPGASHTYAPRTRSSAAGDNRAVAPMRISATPNQRSGDATRSAILPAARLPMASPAMKLASTVLAAYTVTPNTSDSIRSQITWYMRALAPERKKRRPTTSSIGGLYVTAPDLIGTVQRWHAHCESTRQGTA